jgi:hypothetical protein
MRETEGGEGTYGDIAVPHRHSQVFVLFLLRLMGLLAVFAPGMPSVH